MSDEPDKLRAVAARSITDQFAELAPASAYDRQARADGAMEERGRTVAYLRAEAPASSCRLAMLHVADQIERGAHATAPDPHSPPG